MIPEHKALLEHLEWLKVEHRTAYQRWRAAEVEHSLRGGSPDMIQYWRGQSAAIQKTITDMKKRISNAGISA